MNQSNKALRDLEDAVNEEVSLAIHKFHASSGADLTETSLHEATENVKRLARDELRHQLLKDMGAE